MSPPAAGHGHRDPWEWCHPPRCQLYLIVHRNPVGPTDADVDQHHPLGAVQARALNAGVLPPLRPEQVPEGTAGMSPQVHHQEQHRPFE